MSDQILWPQLDGTSRIIEADAIRALVGYVEQRDGLGPDEILYPDWTERDPDTGERP